MEAIVVVAVLVLAAGIISVDTLRQRRRLRDRVDVGSLIEAGLAGRDTTGVDVTAAIATRLPPTRPLIEEETTIGGIWDRLVDAIDPEDFAPKVADGTEIRRFRMRWGDDYAVLASADRRSHYTLELWEADILEGLDGSRTVGAIVVDRLRTSGDFDAGAIIALIESLRLAGIFDPAPVDVGALVTDRMDRTSPARRRLRAFVKDLRISWTGADRFVRVLYRGGLRLLYTPVALVLAGLVSVVGFVAFVSIVGSGRYAIEIGNASVQTLILIALGFFLTFAHELGHAMTLVHYDRKVLSAGFLLYYGSPAFFIDTSDGLMLGRAQRIAQALAGPFAELTLAGISTMLLLAFPDGTFASFLYKFSVLNYYVIFLNLIPLLELDGYWVLADGIEVPDLRPRSIAFLRRELWFKLWHHERFSGQEIGLALYGVVGVAFTLLTSLLGLYLWQQIFGELVLGLWNSGFATRMLMVVLILFFAGPAIRGLISLGRLLVRRLRAVWRRIRFRSEASWRVEAAEMIDALGTFPDIPVDVLNDLAGRVELRSYRLGDTVFRMGDEPDAFYVIRQGSFAVEDHDPDTGDTRTIRVLTSGDSFGEVALLHASPRQATIRALGDTELFRVDKNAFDRLLADMIEEPDFAPTMAAFAELRGLPAFQRLTSGDLAELVEHGDWLNAAPGEIIVRQGDVGDTFYVISRGHAEVLRGNGVVGELGAGDHFGEIALLERIPRTASVLARTPLRAFCLDREGFDAIIASSFRSGTLRRTTDRTWEH